MSGLGRVLAIHEGRAGEGSRRGHRWGKNASPRERGGAIGLSVLEISLGDTGVQLTKADLQLVDELVHAFARQIRIEAADVLSVRPVTSST